MKETARVIKVSGEEVLVRVEPPEQCSKCCSCGAARPRKFALSLKDAGDVSEGDILEIMVEPYSMMKVYALLYAMPLAAFITALFLVYSVTASPLKSFTAACVSLAGAYLGAAFCVRTFPSLVPASCVRKRTEG